VVRTVLRAYRADDLEAAISLWQRAWEATFPEIDFSARLPWWRERWTKELIANNTIVVAERNGEMTGFVVIDPASGYLDQLAVTPGLWGEGIGEALIAEAKRVAPSGIVLHVNTENVRAIRFYERVGFVRAGADVERNPFSDRPVWRYAWKP
jgi:putative acetyltransferase